MREAFTERRRMKYAGADADGTMDSALFGRRPTIMVSTMTMLIQPSSARTSGRGEAKRGREFGGAVGKREHLVNRRVYDGIRAEDNGKRS